MVSAETLERTEATLSLEYAKHDFVEFLRHVKIRSDDPNNPVFIPFEMWPHLVEMAQALQRGEEMILLKERQIGATTLTIAFLYWRVAHFDWRCGYWSKGQEEAREQIKRMQLLHEALPPELRGKVHFTADDMLTETGGGVTAFPATPSAGISFTMQLGFMDEAHFHPYGKRNYTALRPAVKQLIIQSTADPDLGPNGFFPEMYWDAKNRVIPYRAVFYGQGTRVGRDYELERARFKGFPEEFDAYYPETDAAAFVARSGLVYPMFREDVHVKAAPCTWADYKYRVAAVDPGGGDPTAIVPLGITGNRHVHQPYEFYKRGPVSASEIGVFLKSLHQQAPFVYVLVPPEQEVLRAELASMGLPAVKADNRRGEGLGAVASLLEEERLTISPECANSIAEFPGYRWVERVDPTSKDRYATSTPVDHHGDAMDARRYAVMKVQELWRMSGNVVSTMKVKRQPSRPVVKRGFV